MVHFARWSRRLHSLQLQPPGLLATRPPSRQPSFARAFIKRPSQCTAATSRPQNKAYAEPSRLIPTPWPTNKSTPPQAHVADPVGVPRGPSVLRIRQVIYSTKGKATIYGVGFYRSGRHTLFIRRFR